MNESFYTKVVGVTHENEYGESRQEIIRERLYEYDSLDLRREPDNEYDNNAIAVYTDTGEQIGYLSSEVAEELAPLMDDGWEVKAVVKDITGDEGKISGVNIEIEKIPPSQVKIKPVSKPTKQTSAPKQSKKNFFVALFLCVFFGYLGVHRWYVGRGSWWYTLTIAWGGVGWIVDTIAILLGKFKDHRGLPIKP